jgi:hypothetical protein
MKTIFSTKSDVSKWLLLLGIILFAGCHPETDKNYYDNSKYSPLFMTRTELEKSITFLPKKDLNQPGKIYLKDNYIFIVEKYKGIHVINNQDPATPVNIGFIRVPGCMDLAIKANILYADNAVDLVAINISDFSNLSVAKRINNVFPEINPPDRNYIPTAYVKEQRPENTVIVGWELAKTYKK